MTRWSRESDQRVVIIGVVEAECALGGSMRLPSPSPSPGDPPPHPGDISSCSGQPSLRTNIVTNLIHFQATFPDQSVTNCVIFLSKLHSSTSKNLKMLFSNLRPRIFKSITNRATFPSVKNQVSPKSSDEVYSLSQQDQKVNQNQSSQVLVQQICFPWQCDHILENKKVSKLLWSL